MKKNTKLNFGLTSTFDEEYIYLIATDKVRNKEIARASIYIGWRDSICTYDLDNGQESFKLDVGLPDTCFMKIEGNKAFMDAILDEITYRFDNVIIAHDTHALNNVRIHQNIEINKNNHIFIEDNGLDFMDKILTDNDEIVKLNKLYAVNKKKVTPDELSFS